ncbi:MAG: diguanylate cyclase domain-containing protein [Candidatus Woesearchaeota archaeon]
MKDILIIEDTKLQQEKIKSLISEMDYNIVDVFSYGEEALDFIFKKDEHDEQIDLIIIDNMLAGEMNGYQVVQKIISEKNIPFIFLTGMEYDINELKLDNLEASVYLNKPFNKQELKNNIELVLHKFKVNKKLQKNVQEKNLLLGNIDYQIWYLKNPKTYGAVNQAYSNFLGLKQNRIENNNILDVLDKNEAKRCIKTNKKVFKNKKKIKKEEWVINKNGVKRLLLITKTPSLDEESGEVNFVVCSAKDITSEHRLEQQLRKNKNYLQSIINAVPEIVILLDKKGNYLDVWTSKPEDLVASKKELLYKNVNEILPKEAANKFLKNSSRVLNQNKLQTFEYKLDFDEGKKYFETNLVALDNSENNNEILATIRNITERKNLEYKLKEQNKLLEGVIDGISDIIGIQKPDHTIIRYNKAGYDFLDKSLAEVKGKKCHELLGQKEECEKCATRKALESKKLEEVEKYIPEFEVYLNCRSTPVLNKNGEVIYIIEQLRDITERKEQQKKIKKLSFHDQLTGLYNRRYFENEIERLDNSRKIPISIVMGDIDGLKYINDNYGHQMGDKFIEKIGEIFSDSVRDSDIVARVGGDEFSVILPETDNITAKKLCNRIKNTCKNFNKNSSLPEPLKFSLGTATKTSPNQDLNKIFNKADQRMYKNKGRSRKNLS